MANTKLSNTYGLSEIINNIPEQIQSYTKDVSRDIADTKEKSLYYSEKSIVGMITCVILCVIGIIFIVFPAEGLVYSSYDTRATNMFVVLVRAIGCALLLVGIHGIGKMLFARKISACEKKISKLDGLFRNQFAAASARFSPAQLAYSIENCIDEELPESDALDDKLVGTVEKLYSRNKLMNKLTLISRIALPVIFYLAAVIMIFNVGRLKSTGVVLSFLLMIIFSRRVCLLLEYKTGMAMRAVMAVPAVVYGVLMYFVARGNFEDMYFVSDDLYTKMSGGLQPFVSSFFMICLIQVVILVLAVFSQDYYSEKKRLFEGVMKNRKESVHKRWYIYYSAAWHVLLFATYITVLLADMTDIQELDSVSNSVVAGILLGLVWRLISPIWPEGISKAIRKFWGAKYSIVVCAFVFAIIAANFLLSGFVITGYVLIMLISMIVASWIAFAIMVHFWG